MLWNRNQQAAKQPERRHAQLQSHHHHHHHLAAHPAPSAARPHHALAPCQGLHGPGPSSAATTTTTATASGTASATSPSSSSKTHTLPPSSSSSASTTSTSPPSSSSHPCVTADTTPAGVAGGQRVGSSACPDSGGSQPQQQQQQQQDQHSAPTPKVSATEAVQWDVVAKGAAARERFQFNSAREFHEMAFRICVLRDGTEAELAEEVRCAEGAWRDLRPDLTHATEELASGSEEAYLMVFQVVVQDVPLYSGCLPPTILSSIAERLGHRYLSPSLASHCLHLLLALTLPTPKSPDDAAMFSPLVPVVLALVEDRCTHAYPRIVLTALLFLNRIAGWGITAEPAVALGLVRCMGGAIAHSQSLYRVLLASSVLARVAQLPGYAAQVLRDGGVCSLVETLLSALGGLPVERVGQQLDWRDSVHANLLAALRPLVPHAVGVPIRDFLHVWSLVCSYSCSTRIGKLARAVADELTQGGVLEHQPLSSQQWQSLLSCKTGLLEVECIRRLAKRAQHQTTHGPATTTLDLAMVMQFFSSIDSATKSDAVQAALLQCLSELLRCLPQPVIHNDVIRPMLPSLLSEAERLGPEIIEPCIHLSTCLLRSGQYIAVAEFTVKILQALRLTRQFHLCDIPCKNAVGVLLWVPHQEGVVRSGTQYRTRQVDASLRCCKKTHLEPLCIELLKSFDTMIRSAPRDNIWRTLHLLYQKCGEASLATCLRSASSRLSVEEILSLRETSIPLPPAVFVQG